MSLKLTDKSFIEKFLSDLLESVRDDQINKEEEVLLYEFYYKFKFMKEQHHMKDDLVKYLSLGHYIYSQIDKDD
jgi:hypothetical protein